MFKKTKKLTIWVVFLVQILLCQGCNVFGLLLSPSPFDEKVPPKYDLAKQKDKKIILLIEPVANSGVTQANCRLLGTVVVLNLTEKVKVPAKSILFSDASIISDDDFTKTPAALAQQAGAELALYIRFELLDIVRHHSESIFSGHLICRGVLIDAKADVFVCPEDPAGNYVEISEELSIAGREELIAAMCAGAAHCLTRDFYACPKVEYRARGERSALNEMIQKEVY